MAKSKAKKDKEQSKQDLNLENTDDNPKQIDEAPEQVAEVDEDAVQEEKEDKSADSLDTDEKKQEPDTTGLEEAKDIIEDSSSEQLDPALTNAFELPKPQKKQDNGIKKFIIVVFSVLLIASLVVALYVVFFKDSVENNTSSTNQETSESQEVYILGATITEIEGKAEVNTGEGWNELVAGTDVAESNQVRTLEDSRVIITLDDGSAIRLNSNSTVTLSSLNVEEVLIGNESGQIYTRVAPSETRSFVVVVGEDSYQALGTAYKTVNEEDQKGVEVYHSKVKTKDSTQKETEVKEGEAFYTKNPDAEKVDKIAKLDLEQLKDDDFVKWNQSKDAVKDEFKDKLGFIKDVDKPKKVQEQQPEPSAPSAPNGINAWGTKTDNGIKISWSVKGVNVSEGYKVAYSTKDSTPSYGENSAQYVSPGNYSTTLKLTDGNKWYVRVCAYRGDKVCQSYSNTVTVTAPYKEKQKVTRGELTAYVDGTKVYWNYTGKAPYGYKVVWSKSTNPTYPENSYKYTFEDRVDLFDKLGEKKGNYNIRVCAYTNGTESSKCVDYSSNLEY